MHIKVEFLEHDPVEFDDVRSFDVNGGALKIVRQNNAEVYFGPATWFRVDRVPPPPTVAASPMMAEDDSGEGPFWRDDDLPSF